MCYFLKTNVNTLDSEVFTFLSQSVVSFVPRLPLASSGAELQSPALLHLLFVLQASEAYILTFLYFSYVAH